MQGRERGDRGLCEWGAEKLYLVGGRFSGNTLTEASAPLNVNYEFRKHSTMTDFDRPTQRLLTGFVRLHVLHHAVKEDICGNWMIEELRHHGYAISPGTLYPMLRAMEKDGWIVGRDDPKGGSRKLYRATPQGKRALEQGKEKLRELFAEVLRPKAKNPTRSKVAGK